MISAVFRWDEWEEEKKKRRKIQLENWHKRVDYHMGEWEYFTEEEVAGLNKDLIYKLDRARKYYEFPIIITSGFRTPEENDKVGGHPNSFHLEGLAVDIKAPSDDSLREKLAWALGRAGFDQVVSYPRHYHTELDYRNPGQRFTYGSY